MKIILRTIFTARKYWFIMSMSMLGVIGLILTQLYTPWAVGELTTLATNGDPQIAEKALTLGIYLTAIYIIQAICRFFSNYLSHVAAWNFVADMRTLLYNKLQQLSLKYYHDKQTGQLMSRVINDTNQLEVLIAHAMPDLIVNVFVFVIVAIILFSINVELALVCLISLPFLVVMNIYFAKKVLPKFKERQKILGELSGTLQDNFSGIKEIKTFNQEKHEKKKVENLAKNVSSSTIHALKLSAIVHPTISFISSMGTVFVITYGGYLASKSMISIGDVVSFIMYLGLFYQPISTLGRVNEDIQTALASAERIYEVLDSEIDVKEDTTPKIMPVSTGKIDINNVCFHYREAEKILKNIDLHIKPGEIIALVGPTGVGKTTLISLINRFYDPISGNIEIDGHDLKSVTLKSLRDNISVVLQDVFLFNGSVAENIAYGKKDATKEQIIAAAKTARAHEFIETFEEGYDTVIGERGVRLSGGQKQRLSIARAVLRNTPILILDEATASVDVETEKLIHEAMDIVMQNRTTILIAHRLSTVKKADKIVVLADGEITEVGKHEELLQTGGLYSHLAKIQYSMND